MRCDIIIPIWDQPAYTRACIESLRNNTNYPYRLILINNGSAPETADYLKGLKIDGVEIKLIRNDKNLGFVKAVNQGLKASDAPYVCILNNDTIPAPGWLEKLVDFAETHKDVGMMNPVCDGHLDTPIDEYAKRLEANKGRYMEMNQCFGFCMLIKREVIDKIGYLDEVFGVGGYDDTDYSMRAHKAGYRCVSVHNSYVYHKQHISFKAMGDRKAIVSPAEREYFKKWPRHLRVGVSISINDKTTNADIEALLKVVLFLARQWCWVNLWIFGDEKLCSGRIAAASDKMKMPLHQNIKYNYLPDSLRPAQILIRLIERSFGTKRRKRYDAIFTVGEDVRIARWSYPVHRTRIVRLDLPGDATPEIEKVLSGARGA